MVEVSEAAVILARFVAKETPFPAAANLDALHIPISTVHKLDYILTWNFKHIANATIRSKLEVLCQSKGFILPTNCTPEELVY